MAGATGPLVLTMLLLALTAARAADAPAGAEGASGDAAREYFIAPEGKKENAGTREAPWDIASAFAGEHAIAPGSTLWLRGGTYRYPDRRRSAMGFALKLVGTEDAPIQVRAWPSERVTLDGGLSLYPPTTHVWLRDLEITVTEPERVSKIPGRAAEGGGNDLNRPHGGLHIHSGPGCKFINLVVHANEQGVAWWAGSTDSELYGCLIYDNGWLGPDRGHGGHEIYTQNETGLKTISDCILTRGYTYSLHAYGEKGRVDNYLVTHNIVYDAGPFLIGGLQPSRGIRVLGNWLHNVNARIGYTAKENEDCEVRDNVIVNGSLSIVNFKKAVNEGNTVLAKEAARPAGATVLLRPNQYDPNRANLAIFNWAKAEQVEVDATAFLKDGEKYLLKDPKDFFGEPVGRGVCANGKITVPMAAAAGKPAEFAAFVALKKE